MKNADILFHIKNKLYQARLLCIQYVSPILETITRKLCRLTYLAVLVISWSEPKCDGSGFIIHNIDKTVLIIKLFFIVLKLF